MKTFKETCVMDEFTSLGDNGEEETYNEASEEFDFTRNQQNID